MKSILTAASVLLLVVSTMAQAPQKMNYQAVVRDNADQLIVNTQVGMQISVLHGSINGIAVYAEIHTPTTNANGLVTLEIGTGTVVTGDFATIDWSNGPYFIKTETDPAGGTSYSISGTNELLSVPFALFAASGTEGPPGPIGPQGLPGPPGPAGADGADGNGIVSTMDNGNGTFTITYDDNSTFTTSDLTGPQGPAGSVNLYAGDNITISNDTIHAAVASSLTDSDNDTKVQVEATPDEDVIRFDIAGNEKFRMVESRLEFVNPAGSIFIGEDAGLNDDLTTHNNVFIGKESGYSNTDGNTNTSIGNYSLRNNTTGTDNTAIGYATLTSNETGLGNVAIGMQALQWGDANNNTAVGYYSLRAQSIPATVGNNNTALGYQSGFGFTGSNSVLIGYQAGRQKGGDNKLYIANSDADSENALIYGEFDNEFLAINGTLRVNDGTQTDGHVLTSDANGNASWQAPQSINTTYSVGDFAQGGVVFWVDETGQHGLVADKTDQSTTRWWAGTFGNTQAKGDGPYAGEANTSIIIAAHVAIGDDGATYAARICNELQVTEGGKTYGDWYLPSIEELNLMHQNKATINATAVANGGSGIVNSSYWSSTENTQSTAKVFEFGLGVISNQTSKTSILRVRAVRAF